MDVTPGTALQTCEDLLLDQQDGVDLYDRYYEGNHRLRFSTEKFRDVFGGLFGVFSDNWCQIVVDAPVERLEITGFRFGEDDEDDDAAWAIWQRNNLDSESVIAHTEAGKNGGAYILVAPEDGKARITIEHPAQMVVWHSAGDRRKRMAAMKKWLGDDGYLYAVLYLPDYIYWFRSKEKARDEGRGEMRRVNWVQMDGKSGRNKLGVVPVVPIYNLPGLLSGGRSDLIVAIPLQDAINKQVLDMMVASEFQAFRQRVLTGVEIPKNPETGLPLPAFELKTAISRLWAFDSPDAKVTELGGHDLQSYVKPIEMLIQHLAAQSRTPPHYLLSSIINASGDALKAAEAGLVSKVERKILDFSDPWEEAMRLAFKIEGDTQRSVVMDAEVFWGDPEKKTEAEKVDAAQKLHAMGVPLKFSLRRAGFSPKEVKQILAQVPEEEQTKNRMGEPGETPEPAMQ